MVEGSIIKMIDFLSKIVHWGRCTKNKTCMWGAFWCLVSTLALTLVITEENSIFALCWNLRISKREMAEQRANRTLGCRQSADFKVRHNGNSKTLQSTNRCIFTNYKNQRISMILWNTFPSMPSIIWEWDLLAYLIKAYGTEFSDCENYTSCEAP